MVAARPAEVVGVISLVIPVYNEQDSLAALLGEIDAIARRANLELEVVFVDDGSKDRSWPIIAELATANPWVHGIRFRRNFGKAAALSAGFHAARGDIILTLDADLQDDPGEIPRFVEHLEAFLEEYKLTRLIVTSREARFSLVAPCLARFCARWRVAPLEEDAITALCSHWHRLMGGDSPQAQAESREFAHNLLRNESLRRLAENHYCLQCCW